MCRIANLAHIGTLPALTGGSLAPKSTRRTDQNLHGNSNLLQSEHSETTAPPHPAALSYIDFGHTQGCDGCSVPGIGMTSSPRLCTHANASWPAVTPLALAISLILATAAMFCMQ